MASLTLRGTTSTTRDQSVPVPGGGRVTVRQRFANGRPVSPPTIVGERGNVTDADRRFAVPIRPLPPRVPLTTRPTGGGGGGGGGGPAIQPMRRGPIPGGIPVPTFNPRPPIGSIPGTQPGGGGGFNPTSGFNPGPIIDWGQGFLPDWAEDIINVGRRAFSDGTGGGGFSGTSCPEGYKVDAAGRCVVTGVGGAVERFLPGGSTGMLGQGGQAVMGAFGKPAMVPAQVGTIQRKDGTVGPVLRCMAGMVLGKDDLCYSKGQITKADRKWKPAAKPPMSASDAKALRRIGTLQKKIKRLAKAGNMSCKRK